MCCLSHTGTQTLGSTGARTLILCFDGTSNEFSNKNTNVVKLYTLIDKKDPRQCCYYQPGIGTYISPGLVSPFLRRVATLLDQGFAWFIDDHICCGYKFIMQNYNPGDRICLFGFSRGAYIARALAGMLHKVGLLPKDNVEQVPFAYKHYKHTGPQNERLATKYKETFCRKVRIDFLGVWDTVDSVGVIWGRTLPFTTSNKAIKVFRHALALDERRTKFRPNLYHRSSCPLTRPEKSDTPWGRFGRRLRNIMQSFKPVVCRPDDQDESDSDPQVGHSGAGEDEFSEDTDVKEYWFAGSHSDVGGGLVDDDWWYDASRIPLRWMVQEILATRQCGIRLDRQACGQHWYTWFEQLVPPELPVSLLQLNICINLDQSSRSEYPSEGARGVLQIIVSMTDTQGGSTAAGPRILEYNPDEDEATSTNAQGANLEPEHWPFTARAHSHDVVQPLHDKLSTKEMSWWWWIPEFLFTAYRYQAKDCHWRVSYRPNLGRGRELPDNPVFHTSVRERIKQEKYKPRATWNGIPVYKY